ARTLTAQLVRRRERRGEPAWVYATARYSCELVDDDLGPHLGDGRHHGLPVERVTGHRRRTHLAHLPGALLGTREPVDLVARRNEGGREQLPDLTRGPGDQYAARGCHSGAHRTLPACLSCAMPRSPTTRPVATPPGW